MTMVSTDELRALVEKPKGVCVSMYMPTHRSGRETRQDPIRLKNLVRQAEKQLIEQGLRSTDAQDLVSPMAVLLEDTHFWRHQGDGLALFSCPGVFRCYRLPLSFDELVVVTGRFHLKPLLTLFTGDKRFYILALSQNKVRLLEATHYSVNEVELTNVPQSLSEALRYDDKERQLQFHTPTPVGRGGQAAIYHGQGVGADDTKTDLLRYFRRIDRGLTQLLAGERSPLILAAVDYLHPIYAQANTYPHLISGGVAGNPDGMSDNELRDHAWPAIRPHLISERQEASARYKELAGTEHASNKLAKVVAAAYHGRVAQLFVAVGVQRWGSFDPERGRVHSHRKERPGDEDLLDYAAIHTLVSGGSVYAVPPEEMPDDSPLAAIFRY